MGKYELRIDRDRIAEAKTRIKNFYLGEKVDYMPFFFHSGTSTFPKCTNRDIISNPDKAVEQAIAQINAQTDSYPDTDLLPGINLAFLGEGVVPSMFGAKQHVVDDNPPFTEGRLMKDIYDLDKIPAKIDPDNDGWGPLMKEIITKFLHATNGEVPVAVCDHQSTYGCATKIIENENLMFAMYDEPEMVHKFFDIVTTAMEDTIEAITRWAGGEENVAYNVNLGVPGKDCGLIIWDDYISVINPELHMKFCKPYNDRLFDRYGRGHLHTCGPYFSGYIDACLACKPRSLDFAITRGMSRNRQDMYELRKITRENGIILNGYPYSTPYSIFDNKNDVSDDEYLIEMATGGILYNEWGTAESGKAATERWKRISAEAFKRMGR